MSNYQTNTNQYSNIDHSYSKDSQVSKNDRFAKLSEKINSIQVNLF
jgi:hypothetical protein